MPAAEPSCLNKPARRGAARASLARGFDDQAGGLCDSMSVNRTFEPLLGWSSRSIRDMHRRDATVALASRSLRARSSVDIRPHLSLLREYRSPKRLRASLLWRSACDTPRRDRTGTPLPEGNFKFPESANFASGAGDDDSAALVSRATLARRNGFPDAASGRDGVPR